MLHQRKLRQKRVADLTSELCIIRGEFASYLSRSGYPPFTNRLYQNSVERVAIWLSAHGRSIVAITGQDVAVILRDFFLRVALRHEDTASGGTARLASISWARPIK